MNHTDCLKNIVKATDVLIEHKWDNAGKLKRFNTPAREELKTGFAQNEVSSMCFECEKTEHLACECFRTDIASEDCVARKALIQCMKKPRSSRSHHEQGEEIDQVQDIQDVQDQLLDTEVTANSDTQEEDIEDLDTESV